MMVFTTPLSKLATILFLFGGGGDVYQVVFFFFQSEKLIN